MGKKEQVGLRIKTMRKSRGMTQKDLAEAISQAPSSITMYETGRREPNFETLEALADVFNVPIRALIPDEEEEPGHENSTSNNQPKTYEARIISAGIDKMSPERRKHALELFNSLFAMVKDEFNDKEDNANEPT